MDTNAEGYTLIYPSTYPCFSTVGGLSVIAQLSMEVGWAEVVRFHGCISRDGELESRKE